MRVIVVGLGVQGHKRRNTAGSDCVAVVDPQHDEADYSSVEEVPLSDYDAALVCTPDSAKFEVLKYLLSNKKHILVEKPLMDDNSSALGELKLLSAENNVCCYTAYNHRFEPHFIRMKEVIQSGKLGKIYSIRLFYGNGTARLVRESQWRDTGAGVLPDLGSHLLDTFLYWLNDYSLNFKLTTANRFENKAPDHCVFSSNHAGMFLESEMTLLSWRNHFSADVYAENGSAHIDSLCKWGPSTFTVRDRKLPSGRPDEEKITLTQADPTWQLEYQHFLNLCKKSSSNIDNDMWIQDQLNELKKNI